MQTWVLVVAADLKRDKKDEEKPRLGPETVRVCDAAVRAYSKEADAVIFPAVGWSKRDRLLMGHDLMRPYFLGAGIPSSRIRTHTKRDYPFTTNGEMRAFADFFASFAESEADIVVAVRWWHAPRALLLLRTRLLEKAIRPARVRVVPVGSMSILMLTEPLRWLWNIPNYFVRPDSS